MNMHHSNKGISTITLDALLSRDAVAIYNKVLSKNDGYRLVKKYNPFKEERLSNNFISSNRISNEFEHIDGERPCYSNDNDTPRRFKKINTEVLPINSHMMKSIEDEKPNILYNKDQETIESKTKLIPSKKSIKVNNFQNTNNSPRSKITKQMHVKIIIS